MYSNDDKYKFRNSFNKELSKVLAAPVRAHLRKNKFSYPKLAQEVSKFGYNINTRSIQNSLAANNSAAHNFHYWVKLYEVLNIEIDVYSFALLLTNSLEYNKEFETLKSQKRLSKQK